AFLEDSYLETRTPLNIAGGTDVNFSVVNVVASYAANRFRIVFETLKALPVTFTSLKAYQQDKNINVEWSVENENGIKQYKVEKSTDGTSFSSIAVQPPAANNGGSAVYVQEDTKPVEGYNYYRIHSVDINGKESYTNVVKVLIGSIKQGIVIYPNPITDGMIHLQFMNQPEGKYKLRMLNKIGQVIVQKQITHAGGNSTQLLKWNYNLAHGMYQLEVTKPDGSIKNINVLY
ncbi:MAG: T9SS type A sorting domain-containing protein, partial [Ferruginibacter sp.]